MISIPGPSGRLHNPYSVRPSSVAGGFGVQPAGPDTDTQVPAPRRLSPRDAQALMTAELLSAIRSLVESSTEIADRLGRRGAVNGVISVRGYVIPASGVLSESYEVTCGSLYVVNHSAAATIIVQSGKIAGDTGGSAAGVGVQYIGPNSVHRMAIGDRSWTITGTAADKVSVQAFTGLQALGVSVL